MDDGLTSSPRDRRGDLPHSGVGNREEDEIAAAREGVHVDRFRTGSDGIGEPCRGLGAAARDRIDVVPGFGQGGAQ